MTIFHKLSKKPWNPEKKFFLQKHSNLKLSQQKSHKQPKSQSTKKTQSVTWAIMQQSPQTFKMVLPSSHALKQLESQSLRFWLRRNLNHRKFHSKSSRCFMHHLRRLNFQTSIRLSLFVKCRWATLVLLTDLRIQGVISQLTPIRPGMLSFQWWLRFQVRSTAAKVFRTQSHRLGVRRLTAY